MSKVIDMPEPLVVNRRPKPSGNQNKASSNRTSFTYRLYLVVDYAIFDMMEWVKDVLEAPSFGDVVRQAVRAYALELAKTGRIPDDPCELYVENNFPQERFKELNIRIPNRTKQRLDLLKDKTGSTFTDIVSCGLGILVRTAEEQEAILAKLEKGDVLDDNDTKKRIKTRRRKFAPVGHGRVSENSESVNTVKQAIA